MSPTWQYVNSVVLTNETVFILRSVYIVEFSALWPFLAQFYKGPQHYISTIVVPIGYQDCKLSCLGFQLWATKLWPLGPPQLDEKTQWYSFLEYLFYVTIFQFCLFTYY